MKKIGRKISKNLLHPVDEHKRRKAERQRQQGEQQQGQSSSQPPPALPPLQSSSQQQGQSSLQPPPALPPLQSSSQQQGQSSLQPPPNLASSSQQATTPAQPPLQSSSASLTPSDFSKELRAQNGSKDSLTADKQNRNKSDTYAPKYMLHGTSASNADNILKTGLQASYGGQDGGASSKSDDPEHKIRSQGVVHGTASRGIASNYAEFVGKGNNTVLGFRNVHPESTKQDPDSRASYTIDKSIPPNQIVKIPPEKVDKWPTRFG